MSLGSACYTSLGPLIAKLSPSQPANPALGAEIALISCNTPTPTHPPTHPPILTPSDQIKAQTDYVDSTNLGLY